MITDAGTFNRRYIPAVLRFKCFSILFAPVVLLCLHWRHVFIPCVYYQIYDLVLQVRLWKMNAYTVVQLLCLAVLWVVKSTKAALAFPFVLMLMIPTRLLVLPYLFTKQELTEVICSC
jgi:hypothetical protein